MFCVYILYSQKLGRFYVGTTDDPHERLLEHNKQAHDNAFTTRGIPWELYLVIDELTSAQAYAMERHIKSMKSSTYIKNLLKYPDLVGGLRERFK